MILLGDLEADENHLGRLGQVPGITAAVTGTPTTLRGTRRADNILFDRRTTVEFSSSSGVLDLMRELDLDLEAAQEISDHLPVWAELSSYEGGQPGAMSRQRYAGPVRMLGWQLYCQPRLRGYAAVKLSARFPSVTAGTWHTLARPVSLPAHESWSESIGAPGRRSYA